MSKKLFEKFQKIQGEYSKIYPEDKYLGKAVFDGKVALGEAFVKLIKATS